MQLLEAIRLALQSLWANKLKSSFSLVGVFIGVMFLIAVVSIVEGMNTYMTERFAGTLIGFNTFHLRRRPNFFVGETTEDTWRQWARRPRISYEDAEAVREGMTRPVTTAWESSARATLEVRGRVARDVEIFGTTERWFEIKNMDIEHGRAFSAQEVRTGVPVVVLGGELAERLFEGLDPIGREVRIANLPYRVVGVAAKQGNLFGLSLDKFATAPATSPIKNLVNPPRVIDALIVKARTLEDMQAAMLEAEAIMRSRRGLRPTQPNNFALETADAVLDFWSRINRVMLAALPGLVSISLVVGGIVIMNIMLMSVSERTREIGIRKSLGARRRDILGQFLVESATIATVGAGFGILFGIGLAAVVDAVTPLPASVAPWSIAVGVVLGAGVGIVSGVYPATRASRLDPITALRHE